MINKTIKSQRKVKKNVITRAVAWFLAVLMLFSALPADSMIVHAAESSAGESITYDIVSKIGTFNSATTEPAGDYVKFSSLKQEGLWEYAANSTGNDFPAKFAINYIPNGGLYIAKEGVWFAIKITVPQNGTYTSSVNYGKYSKAGNLDVHLVPAAGIEEFNASYLISETKLGTVTCTDAAYTKETWADENGNPFVYEFAEKQLAAGEYYLVYQTAGNKPGYAGNFTLHCAEGGSTIFLLTPTVSSTADSIKVGETATLTATVNYTDGTPCEDAVFSYTSLDESIATVDAATGVVTAVAAGEAKIKVTATKGELFSVITKTLVVLPSETEPGAGFTLTYDIASKVGDFNNKITEPTGDYVALSSLEQEGFWEYAGNNTGYDYPAKYAINYFREQGLYIGSNGKWFAIKITVPKDGTYTPSLNYGKYSKAGHLDVHLVPAADIAEFNDSYLTNETKLGTVTCTDATYTKETWADTVGNPFVHTFSAKQLAAGEYYLVHQTTEGKPGYAGNFMLHCAEGGSDKFLMPPTVKSDVEGLKIGQTATLTTTVYYTDGTLCEDAVFSYTSLDESIATVQNNVVTAVAAGEAKIKVTATKEALTSEIVKKIEVKAPFAEPTAGVSITYDIASEMGQWNIETIPFTSHTMKATNGFWNYVANSSGYDYDKADTNAVNYIYGFGIHMASGNWFATKIYVPEEGLYAPKVKYGMRNESAGYLDVYLVKADVDFAVNLITDANQIGHICAIDASLTGKTFNFEERLETQQLEKGEYYLIYRAIGGEAYGGNFILDGGDNGNGETIMQPVITSGAETLKVGDTAELVAKVFTNKGVECQNAEFSFSSLNTTVATIDNAVIKGVGVGNTTLSVTANVNGKTTVGTKQLVVEENIPYAGVNVTYNIKDNIGKWNSLATEPTTEYKAFSSLTYDNTDGNWAYVANSSGVDYPNKSGINYITAQGIHVNKNGWWTMKIKVPAYGKYKPTVYYGKRDKTAGQLEVYLVKAEGDFTTSLLTNETKIAQINELDASVGGKVYGFYQTLDSIVLEQGEYYLVYKSYGGEVYAGDFILEGVNCIKSAVSKIEKGELNWGETTKIVHEVKLLDGSVLQDGMYTVTYEPRVEGIVSVSEDGTVTGIGDGMETIDMTITDGINTLETSASVSAIDNSQTIGTEVDVKTLLYVGEKTKLKWYVSKESGNKLEIPNENITITFEPQGILAVEDGYIKAYQHSETPVTVKLATEFRGEQFEKSFEISTRVDEGKSEPIYYTYEMRENVLENVSKYGWATSEQRAAIKAARSYQKEFDNIYNLITAEGLPRARQIGRQNDPEYMCCRACGSPVVTKYGGSGVDGFTTNPLHMKWKVYCPDCRNTFPSNDFDSFYKLGLDEQGYFDRIRALEAHREMLLEKGLLDTSITSPGPEFDSNGYKNQQWYDYYGYGVIGGYLYNKDFPKIRESNRDPLAKDENGNPAVVNGLIWGVDDSMGYYPGRTYSNGIIEHHGYIAFYNYELWDYIVLAINSLRDAYLYTGDSKYGIAGAILLDRVADVYPSFNWSTLNRGVFYASDGGSGYGAIQGNILDSTQAQHFAKAADAFYPVLSEPEVIEFLSEKAELLGLENKKESAEDIWRNWEENLLLQIFENAKSSKVGGNFGWPHAAVAISAAVLDKEPQTTEMFEWLYKTGGRQTDGTVTGGNINAQIVDIIDRDGFGNEAAPNYNTTWASTLLDTAEAINRYAQKHPDAKVYDLFNNPKFYKMSVAAAEIILCNDSMPTIGDFGNLYGRNMTGSVDTSVKFFTYLKDTEYAEKLANIIYMQYDYVVNEIHEDVFSDDPHSIVDELEKHLNVVGEKNASMLPAFGLGMLQDGTQSVRATEGTEINNLRAFWMYWGQNGGHGHSDTLGLNIFAFGLDLGGEMGYPAKTGKDPERLEWTEATISHNTVTVNGDSCNELRYPGTPLHFDDADQVKLMDVDASDVYDDTDVYRRSVVMVKIDDETSYGVDFFRIVGGKQHTFSFHTQSHEVSAISGLEMIPDPVVKDANGNDIVGSYAGPDVPYGPDPVNGTTWYYETIHPRGYTWMKNVRRDNEVGSSFSVDFKITDYRNVVDHTKEIEETGTIAERHLHMTQINDFIADEVAFTDGKAIAKANNIPITDKTDSFAFVLTQHKGNPGLESLFTTVYEPYKGARNLKSIEAAEIVGTVKDGEAARAVKVTHESGRIDYIVYSTDNTAVLRVDDLFTFQGFIGVYSIADAESKTCIYRYVNDGTIIEGENDGSILGANTQMPAAYSGTIVDFQKEMNTQNYIDVTGNIIDPEMITGRYIYIANNTDQNAVYLIESYEELGNGTIRLNVGTTTLVHSYKDADNFDKGYNYNIASGQKFSIPLSYNADGLNLKIEDLNNVKVAVDSVMTLPLNVESPAGEKISYYLTSGPRGAKVDENTGVVTWTSSEVGVNHFVVLVRDESGRQANIHFDVEVIGLVSGSPALHGHGSKSSLTLICNGKPEDFIGVDVCGHPVPAEKYGVSENPDGYTIITIKRGYLKDVGRGLHDLVLYYKDGLTVNSKLRVFGEDTVVDSVDASITGDVAQTPMTGDNAQTPTAGGIAQTPMTGDSSNIGLWFMLLAVAVVALGYVGYVSYKKKRDCLKEE